MHNILMMSPLLTEGRLPIGDDLFPQPDAWEDFAFDAFLAFGWSFQPCFVSFGVFQICFIKLITQELLWGLLKAFKKTDDHDRKMRILIATFQNFRPFFMFLKENYLYIILKLWANILEEEWRNSTE